MNPEDFSRDDLLARSVGLPWLLAGLLVAAGLWALSLRLRGRLASRGGRLTAGLFGAVLLGAAFWLAFQVMGRYLALATSWPLWVLALIGGTAAEAIIGIYRLERTLVAPVSRGRWLLALRLIALGILIAILLQPVRSFLVDREINREVVVLIDDSQSMQLSDQRLSATEQLDRAGVLKIGPAAGRPPLGPAVRELSQLREQLTAEREAFAGAPDAAAAVAARKEPLTALLDDATRRLAAVAATLTAIESQPGLPGEIRQPAAELRATLADALPKALAEGRSRIEAGDATGLAETFTAAAAQIETVAARLPSLREAVDQRYLDQLSDADRQTIAEAAARPRAEIARALLGAPEKDGEPSKAPEPAPQTPADPIQPGTIADQTLLDRLAERYDLRFYRFARDPGEYADATTAFAEWEQAGAETEDGAGLRTATDLTTALEHILDNSSPESLAGVLLLSDGRHNGPRLPEDALRQLGVQNSPLSAVPFGGRLGPVDVSILSLAAPESIYLGDRVGVRAEVKFDGLRGQQVKAVLRHGGEVVEEQTVTVPDVNHRTEIRFVHLPEDKGIFDYQLEIEPQNGELFDTNNTWDFKVAVTDDRTNVLLVDGVPRWEFRYLRNLFYGRDKSVHLQYVLLRPDQIEGVRDPEIVAATATRKFGDADADSLPANPDEWKLFDVIILGDIPPGALGRTEWDAIREAVTERGALLVCIGGPRYMPHAHESPVLQELLPITWEASEAPRLESPEPAYRIALTAAGRGHPVMAQSTSRSVNAQLWSQMPPATWRTTVTGVKEGAEVLAYAEPVEGGAAPAGSEAPVLDGSPDSVEAAIRQLANQKTHEQEHALVVVQRAGLGKVAMLTFDQTWRFRYGVGDTYHHRFWGQLVRWGAGENLRSGGEQVRLGTDRLTYTPSDSVEIIAKVLDADRRPIIDADLTAVVLRDGEALTRQKMSYRSGSSGLYETSVTGLNQPGEYTVRLEGPAVDAALQAGDGGGELTAIETGIVVVASRNPVELAELTADRDFLNHAAQVSGGRVAEIGDADSLVETFGAPKETLTERRNITLWDKWPLLALFLGLLTTEWVLRRRSGLA
ncbi:MAG: hypothetical protein JNK37_15435 [Verrucomicrobiales bacterium]|nr:hypothetical protein [Verrucomicrobiales bacterium]